MIMIDNVLISDEVIEEAFVCNLSACKGECCVQGESGGPLEEHEKELLIAAYPNVMEYLTEEGRQAIAEQGHYVIDPTDGIAKTTLMGGAGGPCAYVNYDENGITWCGIEKAYEDGKVTFQKPISCHLFPIRTHTSHDVEFVNYFEWDICDPACTLGKSLKVPVYKFLKQPLIRKYGEEFFETLEATVKYMEENKGKDDAEV